MFFKYKAEEGSSAMEYTEFRSCWPWYVHLRTSLDYCFCTLEIKGQSFLRQYQQHRKDWHNGAPHDWGNNTITDPIKFVDEILTCQKRDPKAYQLNPECCHADARGECDKYGWLKWMDKEARAAELTDDRVTWTEIVTMEVEPGKKKDVSMPITGTRRGLTEKVQEFLKPLFCITSSLIDTRPCKRN